MLIYVSSFRFNHKELEARYSKYLDGDFFQDFSSAWEERFYAMDFGSDGVVDGLDLLHWIDRHPSYAAKPLDEKRSTVDQILAVYSPTGSGIITWDDMRRKKDLAWKWD